VDGPHTRHFAWSPERPYRFRVWSPTPGTWRSEVTDVSTGTSTAVRDLIVPATELTSPVVWAEVFARCDDSPTEARWSQLQATDAAGTVITATAVRPTYQRHAEGGCANTVSYSEGGYFVQATGQRQARPPAPELIYLGR
jgi:hypothetical protein